MTFNVSVVVVAHNEEAKISRCLGSLAAQNADGLDVELILVDDGSTDRTVELAREAAPGLKVVANPSKSISSNRNCGMRAASHEYVAFIDADCEAPAHWLRTLANAMEDKRDDDSVAAVGGANVPPSGESLFYDALGLMLNTHIGSRGSVQGMVFDDPRRVDHLPGLNVLYRKAALEAVGGWDERFALIGEDEDLSRRLGDQGYRLFYVPGAVVVHRQRSTLRAWAKNMHTYGKGRVWLLRRHPKAFELGLLIPPFLPLLLWLYLPIIALVALAPTLRARRPGLWPYLTLLYATTHLSYGLGQWVGLFTAGDSEKSRSKPEKLGLIVLKNAGNLGDAAIFLSVHGRLRDRTHGPALDLYAIGLGPSGMDARPVPRDGAGAERVIRELLAPSDSARTVRVLSLETWTHGFRLLWTLACFRRILFCGGQWIHDMKPAYHVFVCSMVALARLLGTRVGVFAVGMGPLDVGWSRALVRWSFGRKALVVVRDRRSVELCRRSGLGQVVLGIDPALELPSRVPPAFRDLPTDKPWVGLSPCAWFRFDNLYARDADVIGEMERALGSLIEAVEARGNRVLLIPTMNPEDRELCERLIYGRGESSPESPYLLDTTSLSPQDIQGVIERLVFLISMRLHPIIFASNVGTPMAALNYAVKVEEYCADVGLRDRLVDLSKDDWADATLTSVIAAEEDREELVRRIHEGHNTVLERLVLAYDELERWLAH